MVTIIDYGIGNLRSIEKAFEQVGTDVLRTDRPDDIAAADHLVLPGVGAFGACAAELRRRGLEPPIRDAVAAGTPLLGVCIGMQLLFDVGEEMGTHAGLGILPGRVVRFAGAYAPAEAGVAGEASALRDEAPRLKVPHMGWNTVTPTHRSALLDGIAHEAFFYFVHSFHAVPAREEDVLGWTTYGVAFPSIIERGNVFGVQFHPEKSQHNGLRILDNFAGL